MRGRVLILAIFVGLLAFGAVPASAATYCVGMGRACAAADNRASIEAALSAAADHDGTDQVLVGAGTFTAAFTAGFDYTAADTVEIIGRGAGQTIITANPGPITDEAVLTLSGDPNSAVRDLTVTIPAAAVPYDGIVLSGGTVSGVEVGGANTSLLRRAIVQTGGLVKDSVAAAPGSHVQSLGLLNTDGAVENVEVRGATGLKLVGTTTTKRLRAIGNASYGIFASGVGTHSISQAEIRNVGAYGMYLSSTSGEAQSVTVLDTTIHAAGTYGVYSGQGSTSSLVMRGMNVVNNSYGIYRNGSASVNVTYSNLWNNGSGNTVGFGAGVGSISQNPQFISNTNLRLQGTSPLIDAGDPAAAAVAEDNGGRTRDIDGDGDATVRRDIGAHEYQRSLPVISASATPAEPKPGDVITFAANAYDPDMDPIIVGWTFSDGTTANTSAAERTYTEPGTYTGTAIVTDSTGRSSSAQVSVTIPAPPVEEKPVDPPPSDPPPSDPPPSADTGSTPPPGNSQPPPVSTPPITTPPAADLIAPKLSALLLPRTVRLGKAAPAPAPNGTLRFTLSEAATVKVSFARSQRKGKTTRFVKVPGGITVAGRAGVNRIRFAGRLSKTKALKPGQYKITLTPTDAAGNRGTPVSRVFVLR